MNKLRNRHTGHMNAYKARVVEGGVPKVIGKVLYFERTLPVTKLMIQPDGTVANVQIGERIQRVRALAKTENPL